MVPSRAPHPAGAVRAVLTHPRTHPILACPPTRPAPLAGLFHILSNRSCRPGTITAVFNNAAAVRRDLGHAMLEVPDEEATGGCRQAARVPALA